MSPKQLVQDWVSRFNEADVDGLALYAVDATNHQVVMEPLLGREAIRKMFRTEFAPIARPQRTLLRCLTSLPPVSFAKLGNQGKKNAGVFVSLSSALGGPTCNFVTWKNQHCS